MRPIKVGQETEESSKKVQIDSFKNKKFLYNPENKNEKCFLYCLAFFLLEVSDLRTPSSTGSKAKTNDKKKNQIKLNKYVKKFNIKNISFPISINDIKKFLKQNTHLDLKINIFYQTT